MTAADVAPSGPFHALVTELIGAGFTIVQHVADEERFGNSLIFLQRGSTRFRVVKDRSQWFLQIAGPGTDEWFSPEVWLAALDDKMPSFEALTLDEQQSTLVSDRLGEVDGASNDDSGRTYARLRSWESQIAAARRAKTLSPEGLE